MTASLPVSILDLVVIGVIGLVTDFAVKLLNRRLFPWAAL